MKKNIIKDEIYDKIRRDIMEGKFQVDDVYTEKELAEKYGVGKTPVREAMIQLCSESILENYPRFGYKLVQIQPKDVANVVQYRKIIEIEGLKLCFSSINDSDIQKLKAIDTEYNNMPSNRDIYNVWINNVMFHNALSELCPNVFIRKSVSDALNLCTRFVYQYFNNSWTMNNDRYFHNEIIDLIENKDMDSVLSLLSEDIEQLLYTF